MGKKILVIASNYGVWAEELVAPWDILKNAGHDLQLATYKGMVPLPASLSMDTEWVDPQQGIKMNPQAIVDRMNELLDTGEWDLTAWGSLAMEPRVIRTFEDTPREQAEAGVVEAGTDVTETHDRHMRRSDHLPAPGRPKRFFGEFRKCESAIHRLAEGGHPEHLQ